MLPQGARDGQTMFRAGKQEKRGKIVRFRQEWQLEG
jgi:hypothetical protein